MQRRLFSLALPLWCATGFAQTPAGPYPSKPVRILATAQPGGASDFVARLVGERLSKSLGQPVVVENRAGANGALGLTELARAPADGYTIGVCIGDSLMNNVAMIKNLAYDPRQDFAYITQFVRSPALLSANTELGVKNMDDFKRLAAQGSVSLSYGSWGPGGLGHLAGEALNRRLNAKMVHVPQRGEAPVMQDLLSKTVSVGLTSAGLARQHVQAGKIVPLAIMGRERSAVLPQVPTMKELGFDEPIFEAAVWIAFVAPAKTPPAVLEKLSAEIRVIGTAPDVRSVLADRGLEPMNTSPTEFASLHRREMDVILKRMKDFGIEGD